jgi:Flp pilus assembly protein TadD
MRSRIRRVVVFSMAMTGVVGAIVVVRDDRTVEGDAQAARVALASGRAMTAREPLRRWLRARPSSAEAHAMMAEVALADGDLGEVTRLLNEARSLGYPAAKLERLHAISLARIGRFAEAEPILTRLRDAGGKPDPAVDEALARIYLKSYRLAQAQAVIRRWIRDAPADGRPYVWLTEIDRRIEVDNPGSWEQHYREALRRDPDLDVARLGLAETLRQLHRAEEADREYKRYLGRHPDDPAALAGAGRNALELGDASSAAELLDRALALAPADPMALKGRSDVDIRRRDLASAGRRLDQVLQANPFDQEALHSRAGVRALLGNRAGAQADRTAFEQLKRDQAELLKLRGRVLGEPNNIDLRSNVAAWMFAHGRDQEGLGWALAALTANPNHAPTCRLLADYHARRPGEAGLANFYRLKAVSHESATR